MEIFAYIASALVGVSLGLTGGGGSILTVPILVYLFGLNPMLSTSYSLFIVGSTSLMGAISNYRKGLINIKAALAFGILSTVTVFAVRKFLIPVIPEKLFTFDHFIVTRDFLTMILFAMLMLGAAIAMILNGKETETEKNSKKDLNIPELLLSGAIIGLITGLLGAGSGFLLIPMLVLMVGLPMKEAIGTSLLIIALNSMVGFIVDLGHFDMNWPFLIKIASINIAGIFIGGAINNRINGRKLKIGFGWFVLVMGTYIIIKELFLK